MRTYGLKHLFCTYCGDVAADRDHVVPKSLDRRSKVTVPACVDCNQRILKALPLFTIDERKAYIAEQLKNRMFNMEIIDDHTMDRFKFASNETTYVAAQHYRHRENQLQKVRRERDSALKTIMDDLGWEHYRLRSNTAGHLESL